jgi:hypothetical protein
MCSFTDGEVAVKHHESWGFENHNRDRVSDRRCDLHVKPSLDELASHPSSNGRSICDDEGVWSIVQAWGSSNTFTWSSPATSGSYVVEVDVRNAGANEDPWDSYLDVGYILS